MTEVLDHPETLRFWQEACDARGVSPALADKIYDGYTAAVDYPTCLFVADLLATSPNAKVILTVREPKKWLASVRETIFFTFW